jgi:hypothetical protein
MSAESYERSRYGRQPSGRICGTFGASSFPDVRFPGSWFGGRWRRSNNGRWIYKRMVEYGEVSGNPADLAIDRGDCSATRCGRSARRYRLHWIGVAWILGRFAVLKPQSITTGCRPMGRRLCR